MVNRVSVDLETFSSVDLKKSGLYRYVQSPDFEILMCAYSINGQPVCIYDLTNADERSRFDSLFRGLLFDTGTVFHAYNASFEATCLARHFGIDTSAHPTYFSRFRCTMMHGLYCGYTAGLAATAVALGLPEDKRKMSVGGSLIKTFCVPCTPTKNNGNRTRTLPHHEPEKWSLFKEYCRQDVVTEMEIERRLTPFPVPAAEQHLWELDQVINARGVAVDLQLVDGAIYCAQIATDELMHEARELTGLDNPKSVKQLLSWLNEELDEEEEEVTDLQKATVTDLLGSVNNDRIKRVLEIRQNLSKASVKKFDAIRKSVCDDSRIRGLLMFYGANRTGRWAGRQVQPQNLPKNSLETLDHARECAIGRKLDAIRVIYGSVPETLSHLVRTAFVPAPGCSLVVADFSAIEARVLAWLAGEQWRLDVFAGHGKIYEASASQMFGVPIELIAKGHPEYALRQKGKVAELALGYQGGAGALIKMGALKMGLTEEELPEIVSRWRNANKRIGDFWRALENAALSVMQTGQPVGVRGLIFAREGDYQTQQDFLTITLPSGRKLFYARPFLQPNRFDREAIHFRGVNQKTRKWEVDSTYGGKLTENVTQAIARDCLAEAIRQLELVGSPVAFHVHDEVVLEAPASRAEAVLQEALRIMAAPIVWAPGLPLKGDGFVCDYYRKE